MPERAEPHAAWAAQQPVWAGSRSWAAGPALKAWKGPPGGSGGGVWSLHSTVGLALLCQLPCSASSCPVREALRDDRL